MGIAVTTRPLLAQTYPSYPSYPTSSPLTSFPPPTAYTLPATPTPSPLPAQPPAQSGAIEPVRFWSDTALQLDVLDHSIDATDARAPGPCAPQHARSRLRIL